MARPTILTDDLTNEICQRIAEGESVRQISLLEHMPDRSTLKRWIATNEAFQAHYARAKEAQMEHYAEEIVDIAEDGRNDWEERENKRTGETYVALNHEAIDRSKLRIEARKWLMGKLKPKKYGEVTRLEGAGPNGEHVMRAVVNVTIGS